MRSAPAAIILWTCVIIGYGIGFAFGGPIIRGTLLICAAFVILALLVWLIDTIKKDRE